MLRESDRRYSKPFKVIGVDGKLVFVIDNDREVQFHISQVMPTSKYDATINGDQTMDILHNFLRCMKSNKQNGDRDNASSSVHINKPSNVKEALISEVLNAKDPKTTSYEATEAKRKEISNIAIRVTWTTLLESEVPAYANILTGRFIVSIKETETNNSYYKTRYVVYGNLYRCKESIVQSTTTVRQ